MNPRIPDERSGALLEEGKLFVVQVNEKGRRRRVALYPFDHKI